MTIKLDQAVLFTFDLSDLYGPRVKGHLMLQYSDSLVKKANAQVHGLEEVNASAAAKMAYQ